MSKFFFWRKKDEESRTLNFTEYPMLWADHFVILPHTVVRTDLKQQSIPILEVAKQINEKIFLVPRSQGQVTPDSEMLHTTGTIAQIISTQKLKSGDMAVELKGLDRGRAVSFTKKDILLIGRVEVVNGQSESGPRVEKLVGAIREAGELIKKDIPSSGKFNAIVAALKEHDPTKMCDVVAGQLDLSYEEKKHVLDLGLENRLKLILKHLQAEISTALDQIFEIEVEEQIAKLNKDHFIRMKIDAMRRELGLKDRDAEFDELRQRIEATGMSQEAREKALLEIERLERAAVETPEGEIGRKYIEWLLEVPWTNASEQIKDANYAQKVLDDDHYGLIQVKERILESLAVQKLAEHNKGSIICFAGPPGVGKTSLGRSIASATGRRFVRLSLGGTRDEAEIRGHRRTYIGAMPGQIIQMMRRAGTINPLILLDELDKLQTDLRHGDPAAALLEALDPEQNSKFRDNYLNVEYDLSHVLFIGTCNIPQMIPPALRDRLDVISLAGYTDVEKLEIARRYLVPKKLAATGLNTASVATVDSRHRSVSVEFDKSGLQRIIELYKRDPGMRNVEREIESVCRKIARKIVAGEYDRALESAEPLKLVIDRAKVTQYLDPTNFWQSSAGTSRVAGLIETLDRKLVGHRKAKRVVAAAAIMHYGYAETNITNGLYHPKVKQNILIIGPPATGKTLLARSVADALKVPFATLDAVKFSHARHGANAADVLVRELVTAAGGSVRRAQRAIASVQGLDRMIRQGSASDLFFTQQAQETLAGLIDGDTFDAQISTDPSGRQTIQFSTQNVLFICEGTFPGLELKIKERLGNSEEDVSKGELLAHVTAPDLLAYGMSPDLVRSFDVIAVLDEFSRSEVLALLDANRDDNLITKYQQLLSAQGYKVEFTEDARQQIASEAFARGSGAQGINAVLYDVYMYVTEKMDHTAPGPVKQNFVAQALRWSKAIRRTGPDPVINVAAVELPPEAGFVFARRTGKGKPTLFLVQHTHNEGPDIGNLPRVINHLIVQHNVSFFGIPGNPGVIRNSSDLTADPELDQIGQGILSVIAAEPAALHGVGTKELDDKCAQLAVDIRSELAVLQNYIAEARKLLEQLQHELPLTEDVADINKVIQSLRVGTLDPLSALIFLHVTAVRLGVELPAGQYPALEKLIQARAIFQGLGVEFESELVRVLDDPVSEAVQALDKAPKLSEFISIFDNPIFQTATELKMPESVPEDFADTGRLTSPNPTAAAHKQAEWEKREEVADVIASFVRRVAGKEPLGAGEQLPVEWFMREGKSFLDLLRKLAIPEQRPNLQTFLLGLDCCLAVLTLGAEADCRLLAREIKAHFHVFGQAEQQVTDKWLQKLDEIEDLSHLRLSKWTWACFELSSGFDVNGLIADLTPIFPRAEIPDSLKDEGGHIGEATSKVMEFYKCQKERAFAMATNALQQIAEERCKAGCLVINEFEAEIIANGYQLTEVPHLRIALCQFTTNSAAATEYLKQLQSAD